MYNVKQGFPRFVNMVVGPSHEENVQKLTRIYTDTEFKSIYKRDPMVYTKYWEIFNKPVMVDTYYNFESRPWCPSDFDNRVKALRESSKSILK